MCEVSPQNVHLSLRRRVEPRRDKIFHFQAEYPSVGKVVHLSEDRRAGKNQSQTASHKMLSAAGLSGLLIIALRHASIIASAKRVRSSQIASGP